MNGENEPTVDRKDGDSGRIALRVLGLSVGWQMSRVFVRAVRGILHGGPATSSATAGVALGESMVQPVERDNEGNQQQPHSKRRAEFIITLLMVIAIVSAVAFLVAYWTNAGNLILGGTLALALGAFGAALVFFSHSLMAQDQLVEHREILVSPRDDREAASEEFHSGIQRRGLLKGLGAAMAATMGAIVISLFRSFGRAPDSSLFTTVWKQGQSLTALDGTAVTVNALQPGASMLVFPQESIGDEKSQTVLIRVRQELLQLPNGRADWAPMGYVAYSRVCTHAGCPVGVFESTTDLLMCPCHQSTFDVLRGAKPTSGPADRPLPQLPLYVAADRTLRAAGGFSEPPGPGFWGIP